MDDELVSKLVVGLVASVFTFILGVIYTSQTQRKQFRLSFKSFLTVSLINMKNDFHKIHKGDGNVRHVITQNYKEIRDHYNNNKKEPIPDLSYLSLKNLGSGVILQCKIDAKYFVENCDYRFRVGSSQQIALLITGSIDYMEKGKPRDYINKLHLIYIIICLSITIIAILTTIWNDDASAGLNNAATASSYS